MARVLTVLLSAIIVFYILGLCAVYLLPHFDFQFVNITYNDESVGIANKDVILTRPVKLEDLEKYDIIVYNNNNGGTIVRKLAEVNPKTNIATVIIQETDIKDITENIPASKIIGEKVINIKRGTTAINFLHSFIGKMLCAIITGIFVIFKVAFGRRKGSL